MTDDSDQIADDLEGSVWLRLSAGEGTKGARLQDWAYVDLADLNAAKFNDQRTGLWTRGLLICRHVVDGDLAYFSTWCPAGTSIETPVKIEGHWWTIEDSSACWSRKLAPPPKTMRRALANMPSLAPCYCAQTYRLERCLPPIASPRFEVSLAWHIKTDVDPAFVGFRAPVADLVAQLRTKACQQTDCHVL